MQTVTQIVINRNHVINHRFLNEIFNNFQRSNGYPFRLEENGFSYNPITDGFEYIIHGVNGKLVIGYDEDDRMGFWHYSNKNDPLPDFEQEVKGRSEITKFLNNFLQDMLLDRYDESGNIV